MPWLRTTGPATSGSSRISSSTASLLPRDGSSGPRSASCSRLQMFSQRTRRLLKTRRVITSSGLCRKRSGWSAGGGELQRSWDSPAPLSSQKCGVSVLSPRHVKCSWEVPTGSRRSRQQLKLRRMSRLLTAAAIAGTVLAACGEHRVPESAPWTPLAEVEAVYGPLVTAGNHPTPDQHGTGERVGIFQDSKGTVWGLPLSAGASGEILACAPSAVHEAKVTGAFTLGATVIGSTNEPTGWRGGTGDLELLLRDQHGNIRWEAVHGGQIAAGP